MEEIECKQIGIMEGGKWDKVNDISRRVYDEEGCSPTIHTMGGGNLEPKVKINEATKKGFAEVGLYGAFDMAYPDSETRRGRVQEGGNVTPTLTATNMEIGVVEPTIYDDYNGKITKDQNFGGNIRQGVKLIEQYRIRKLTPKECWRLMGFADSDFYKAAYGKDIPVDLADRIEQRDLKKWEWYELWRYMRRQEVSNSQLYKQAGNSIVVDVLMAIFKEML